MNKIKKFLIFGFMLMYCHGISQEALTNIIPPSPEAASLAQYADIPVNLYTGVPDISIPFYEIKQGNFSLPITFNYHASGIKVEQESSSVGLGWVLNCGGVITRVVRDKDDLSTSSTIGYPKLPPFNGYEIQNILDVLGTCQGSICNSEKDTEPDLFYFNFCGQSGKFLIDKSTATDDYPVKFITPSPYKLKFISGGWQLKDDQGIIFSFTETEKTESYSGSFTYKKEISPTNDLQGPVSVISAWYLKKIEFPNGNLITFTYDNNYNRKIYSITKLSQEKRNSVEMMRYIYKESPSLFDRFINLFVNSIGITGLEANSFLADVGCTDNTPLDIYNYSCSVTDDIHLSNISFPNGKMNFYNSTREDLRHMNFGTPLKLDSFEVRDESNHVIKKVVLKQDYFNQGMSSMTDPWKYLRLRLNKLTIKNESEELNSYGFSYNNYALPEKNSNAQDYWGFCNGQSRNDISNAIGVPSVDVTEVPSISDNFKIEDSELRLTLQNRASDLFKSYEGDNRESNSTYLQTAILNSITYPTGSKRLFFYEPHDYFLDQAEPVLRDTSANASACSGGVNCVSNYGIAKDTIEIDLQFAGTVNIRSYFFLTNSDPIVNMSQTDFGMAELIYPNGTSLNFKNYGEQISGSNQWKIDYNFDLQPGHYIFVVTSSNEFQAILNAYWKYFTGKFKLSQQAGGLRIARIHDSAAPNSDINYYYSKDTTINVVTQKVSTGKLLVEPVYSYWEFKYGNCVNTQNQKFLRIDLIRVSTPTGALACSQSGSPIGYDLVTVEKGGINGGKIENYFMNDPEIPFQFEIGNTLNRNAYVNPLMPNRYRLSNGLPVKIVYKDKDGKKVKEIINTWEKDSRYLANIIGLRIRHQSFATFYDQPIEWWNKTKIEEINYTKNGTFSNVYDYEYNDKNFSISKETINDGQTSVIKFKYPTDYFWGNSPIYDEESSIFKSMVDRNIINAPIEKTTLKNGLVIGTELNLYMLKNNLIVPKENYFFEYATPLSEPFLGLSYTLFGSFHKSDYYKLSNQYQDFDSKGNLTQTTGKDGITRAYYWAYNKIYPVARIENMTYQDILNNTALKSSLDQLETFTDLNDAQVRASLKTLTQNIRTSLPASVVSTLYTYKPLVGMTSSTDPNGRTTYYEYDSFGRLHLVKDDNGNILKKTDYHYANQ